MSKIVVALVERAEGNESIGTAWIDTGLFSPNTPLKEVMAWAQRLTCSHDGKVRGRVMLSYPDDPLATLPDNFGGKD